MRVALYSRYSSDRQNETSIEQQVRLLRARAASEGWEIVGEYEDKALTGTNMLRPGLQQLMAVALDQQCDCILSESLDRISRDLADLAAMNKRLRHRGIQIVTLMEGTLRRCTLP